MEIPSLDTNHATSPDGAYSTMHFPTTNDYDNMSPSNDPINVAIVDENSHHGSGPDSPIHDSAGSSTPRSATMWEDAYANGYKEGYTSGFSKAHVDLKHQPIAIVGMSCRFPGSVSTPDEFWELLARSRTGFSSIPASRFSKNRFVHPNPGKSGTTNAQGGNFLTQDLTAFDAPFFGFTQQEAISLDPQQRLLLECTFEAIESAGVPKHEIIGKNVGVFVGGTFSEYEADLFRDPETIPMHQATGCAMAMQSNRISHFFDLRGPSFTVDTACSSSLVALHTACQSVRNGESSMAIAAGVHLNILPEFWISYSMSRLFGEGGRSYAFDNRGTGYGRGEGCGMVILKTLEQALKDNDPIRAVITGSGINQDGKTPGITMPNGSAQENLIRSVYAQGGMDPRDTGYVEAHGTGTRVGDPIEVSALHNVFGEGRTKRKPLFLGSVKSNIGHLEAAAGIAGIIKTALMLERGFIVPNYDFKHPNDKIPFDEWGLKVPVRQQPWPIGKRWASVNGFGFGGTNAHVVLTRGPLERKTMKEEIDVQAQERLFVLSGNDKTTAETVMKNLGIYLEQRPEVFQNDLLSNLAYTLGQRKSLHPWRVAVTAASAVQLVETLSSGKISPVKQEPEVPALGWVFTGQGAQWWAMGRELYDHYPIYAAALDRADMHLNHLKAPFSLLDELRKDEATTRVNIAHISQPACTAIQLALIELLSSWNIKPTAVVGHSSGEIAAAYSAGIIDFEDAMTIAYHRGRLIPILKERFPALAGCMLAVGAGTTDILPLIEEIPRSCGEARIACINSPSSVTVSGDTSAVVELQRMIEAAYPGTFARQLAVDTAYHSHHMSLVAKDYTDSLVDLRVPQSSGVRFHSSLLGRIATADELDASYWVQNLTCAVRFDEAVQSMVAPIDNRKTGIDFLLELGPHAALQGPIKQILKQVGGSAPKLGYAPALVRKKNAIQTALSLAGTLFVKGCNLDMGSVNFPKKLDRQPQVLTDLPRYAWNHSTTYYHESRLTKVHKYHDAPRNDLLGVLAPYSNEIEPTWRNIIRLDDLPWLRHHQMQGVTIFPISGFAVMAIEAIAQQAELRAISYDSVEIIDLVVKNPVMLSEEDLELTTTLRPDDSICHDMAFAFQIHSWSKSVGWKENCTGSISVRMNTGLNEVDGPHLAAQKKNILLSSLSSVQRDAQEAILASDLYSNLSKIGVSYGAAFQSLVGCHASLASSYAEIHSNDTASDMPNHFESDYIIHPTVIEQLITMYWPVLGANGPLDTVHLPSSIGKLIVSLSNRTHLAKPLQAFCESKAPISLRSCNKLAMTALSASEEPLLVVEDLLISPILESNIQDESSGPRELCYKLDWEVAPTPDHGATSETTFDTDVVIIHGSSEEQLTIAAKLSDQLVSHTGKIPVSGSLTELSTTIKDKLCICIEEISLPHLASLDETSFQHLQTVLTNAQGMLWVVRGAYSDSVNPHANMITGLSRTLRSEGTLINFVTLDLDAQRGKDQITTIMKVFMNTLGASSPVQETEFVERHGELLTPRIINDDQTNEYVDHQINPPSHEPASFSDCKRPLRGVLETPNLPDSLVFDDLKLPPLLEEDVEFHVKAIGINHEDSIADSTVGLGCSGIVTAVGKRVPNFKVGDHVAGITRDASISTVARAHYQFLFKVPHDSALVSAAALPFAYGTASYALNDQARLREGESVLLHDAASAVGQAALSLAQEIGAEIWVTVRTAEQKSLIMREFGVPEDRIMFGGNGDFACTIRHLTRGRGVDVVLDTLSEKHLDRATCETVADFGRLIRVGRRQSGSRIAMKDNTTHISVDLKQLIMSRPQTVQRVLAVVARLLKQGKIGYIHGTETYGISQAVAALQRVQSADPHGKVLIVPGDGETVMAPRRDSSTAVLRKDATYVLIGGTGGLGRSMARWMISKGAKNLVLVSRSGELHGQAKQEIDTLNDNGANIVVRSCDVANQSSVDRLIAEELVDMPPVRGVIHGAMVLHDVLFEKMTYVQYSSVIASKVHGAWNFHNALQSRPSKDLDFFVVISSAAGAVGNRGQAAYAAANTFLNGFTQHLLQLGIHSASLDLTAVSDAGYLAGDAEKAAEVARNLGSDTICEAEVLALLQGAIEGKLDSCNNHPITGMRITPTMQPFWTQDPKFKHLFAAAQAASANNPAAAAKISWSAAFKAATSRADAEAVVVNALREKIAEVISIEPEDLDVTRSLSNYPLDSLTAIEVRNFITRMFESSLQVLELLASGSVEGLAKVVVGKTKVALPKE